MAEEDLLHEDFEIVTPDIAPGFELQPGAQKPKRTVGTKMYQRFFGTDVEDPFEYSRMGAQAIGGVGGGLAGASAGAAIGAGIGTVGSPIGTGIGALIGGAIGGIGGTLAGTVAPEASMELGEFLGFNEPGTREKLGLSNEDLMTVLEGEALLDIATSGGVALARLGVRGAARGFSALGRKGKSLAKQAAEYGIGMLPVQVAGKDLPRGFVTVMGRVPFVGGPIRRNILQTERMFKEAFEKLPAEIAPVATLDEVSHEVFTDASKLVKSVNDDFRRQYTEIYKRADDVGARVHPHNTAVKAQEILDKIDKTLTPSAAPFRRRGKPSETMQEVKSFITSRISPMFKVGKTGGQTVAPQTLEQMGDGVLGMIDEKIASLGKRGSSGRAMQMLTSLRGAVMRDISTQIDGTFANSIAMDLKVLGEHETKTIAELFQTAAAKKFGTVKRGGLTGFDFDYTTKVSMDNLVDVLMRDETPSTLVELKRLVTDDTFKKMSSSILARRIDEAFTTTERGQKLLDIDQLSKSLGLNEPLSKRFQHTKKLLELSGGLDVKKLKTFMEIGEAIAGVEAPDASVFLARRMTIGGTNSLLRALVPGGMVTAGGAAAGGASGALLGGLMFIGGSRFIGKAITDPKIAQPLLRVLEPETKNAVKKFGALQAWRAFIHASADAGELAEDELQNARDWGVGYIDTWSKTAKAMEERSR